MRPSVKRKKERRWKLYDQGLCDKELARESGVSQRAITAWRSYHGLPINKAKYIPRKKTDWWDYRSLPAEDRETVVKFVATLGRLCDDLGVELNVTGITKACDVWRAKGELV